MTKTGIDVSQWQGNINWASVKASGKVDYAILRAGYGRSISQKDPTFETNYANAKAAGIPLGVYWYSYATSISDAQLEARTCIEVIKGKQFEYPIYFDLEERSQFNNGRDFCSSLVNAFCQELEKSGYFAGLYISRSPLQSYITPTVASRYALWIAEYASRCNYSGDYGMWQYTSGGSIPGISGSVDMDKCYIDYPSLIKKAGLNGFEKPKETPTAAGKKVFDTEGFSKGDKNDGVLAYKQLLIIAHNLGLLTQKVDNNDSYGDGTVKATNELLEKLGKIQNGIAGPNLIKNLGESIKAEVKK